MTMSLNLAACLALGAVEVALAGLSFVSYRNTGRLEAMGGAVTHGREVMEQTTTVLTRLEEAEADERGYVLSGEPEFLAPYRVSLTQVNAALRRLEELTGSDPEERRQVEELKKQAGEARQAMDAVIGLREGGHIEAARARTRIDGGPSAMSEVRRVGMALTEFEGQSLSRHQAETAEIARGTRNTILVGNGLLVIALAFAGALVYGEARARRLSRERYQRLVELCPDAILIVRGDRVVFANGTGVDLLGPAPGQLVGRSPFALLPPEHEAAVRQRFNETLATGRTAPPLAVTAIGRGGKLIDVELICSRLTGDDITALQVVLHDVSERKRLESGALRAQRLESVGRLAGGMAHDLNNILTPILMGAKLLVRERPEAQRRELLGTIQTSAERGAEMVRQLLAFAGGAEGPREPLHLKPVIREVQTLLSHTLPKSIRLRVETPPDLRLVSGDATQLTQVLVNLCVNARDAMSVSGNLTLSAANTTVSAEQARLNDGARPGPHVALAVTDTGTGIAPDLLDKIFDPFFTTKERGKGTGLGLSTTLGIVRGHGGFVSVYTEPGKGSRFTVYLPALVEAGEPVGQPATPTEVRRVLPEGHGELVLIIDDESAILLTAGATLEAHGYRVLTTTRGAEGLEIYRRSAGIRAVLVDMMMPGLDGPATMRKLLEIDPKACIIAASGMTPAGATAAAVAECTRAFLHKPYNDEQLLRTLAEVLRVSGEQAAAPSA